MAYLLDAMPIFLILMILNTLFVGELLKKPYTNYDENYDIYQENVDDYYDEIDVFAADLEAEIITQGEYDTLTVQLRDDFLVDNEETKDVVQQYLLHVLYYFIISFIVIKYIYTLVTKGQTFGLKLMNLVMVGRINWFSLILREVFWREVFWFFTFGVGMLVDLVMVTFTSKKKTLRDIFSNTQVINQGTSYPF